MVTVDFFLTKWSTVFLTEYIAALQLDPFLKPNWRPDVFKNGANFTSRTCSNNFEMMGVREIPRYPSTVIIDFPAFGIGTSVPIPKARGTYSVRIIQLNNDLSIEERIG